MSKSETLKIMNLDMDSLEKYLKSGQITVCVIGIGRIGLPTALSFANAGLQTIGVDINTKLVEMINRREYPLKDEPEFDKIFDTVIINKKFHATTNIEETIPKSDVILLSLPTPMDENYVPNYSALLSVGKSLNKLLAPGSLIVVESTIEPGFIENDLVSIIEGNEKNHKVGVDFGLAVCPETANPGEILSDFRKLPRLAGGTDEKTTNMVSKIYKHVFGVEILHMPNCKTANAAKLTANVFRDINIAFVNELAMLFEKIGIDTLKVLEACDKKYNFQIHYPGAGVGGPCLPVNSYKLLNSARRLDDGVLRIIEAAREINEHMPYHTVELLIDALNEIGKSVKNSTIAILGVSYKPNIRDIQLAPAEEIIKKLNDLQAKIKIYDPFYKSTEVFSHKTEENMFDTLSGADAVIIVTAHNEFKNIDPTLFVSKMKTPIVVDARGIIDSHTAKKSGLIFRGIGRGKI